MHRLLVVIALLAACGSKGDKGDTGDKGDKKGGGSSTAQDPPKKDEPAAKKPPADLFTGTSVTLPAPADKLELEMSEDAARKAAPEVFAAQYGYEVPGFDKVKLHVQLEGKRVYSIRAEIAEPVDTVKGWLAKKWGEPRVVNKTHVWNAPAVGLRAKLEGSERKANLYYSQVQSLEQLLGTEPKRFGFEKIPLIGAKADEVMKTFEAYRPKPREQDPGLVVLTLPAVEQSEHTSWLALRVKNGVVTGFTLTLNHGDDPATKAVIAKRLEAMFGKGTVEDPYISYPGPVEVKAELRKDTGFPDMVWVGDYRP